MADLASLAEEDGTVLCSLPHPYWFPRGSFPGSDHARSLGCTCPGNQPWPGKLRLALGCKEHVMVTEEKSDG